MPESTEIKSFEEEFDEKQEIAQSNFADMLHDWERNQKYELGLKAAITAIQNRNQSAIVLDIGTGTGLLSMMAIRAGADSVIACDGFLPAADCALKIIAANGMSDKIKLIPKHSTELKVGFDMNERANILVTEVFDTELIGEGAIETFNHAHRELLTTDCIVVPHRAQIYVQLVESSLVNSWNQLKLLADSDGEVLLKTPPVLLQCPGDTAVHDLQLSQLPSSSFRALTNPVPVLEFDFSGKTEPIEKSRSVSVTTTCVESGLAHAVFMWWDITMDVDNQVTLSCAPYWAHPDLKKWMKERPELEPADAIPWRDHWMQAIYYLPRTNNLMVKESGIDIHANHDEFSLWFEVTQGERPTNIRPVSQSGLHVACSRTRIGQLNDNLRNKKLIENLERAKVDNGTVLVLSQGCSLTGLATAKYNLARVMIVEPSKVLQGVLTEYITYNKLKNVELYKDLKSISTLEEVTHLIAEPFYSSALLPWDHFEYFSTIFKLRNKMPKLTHFSPIQAQILALPVRFLNLHKINESLKVCEGFDMTIYDKLIEEASTFSDPVVEAQPLWEYPGIACGTVKELLNIDVENLKTTYESECEFELKDGANALAFWVDWKLNQSQRSVVTTGPIVGIENGKKIIWTPHNRQGVRFVDTLKTKVVCKIFYSIESNEIKFLFS